MNTKPLILIIGITFCVVCSLIQYIYPSSKFSYFLTKGFIDRSTFAKTNYLTKIYFIKNTGILYLLLSFAYVIIGILLINQDQLVWITFFVLGVFGINKYVDKKIKKVFEL